MLFLNFCFVLLTVLCFNFIYQNFAQSVDQSNPPDQSHSDQISLLNNPSINPILNNRLTSNENGSSQQIPISTDHNSFSNQNPNLNMLSNPQTSSFHNPDSYLASYQINPLHSSSSNYPLNYVQPYQGYNLNPSQMLSYQGYPHFNQNPSIQNVHVTQNQLQLQHQQQQQQLALQHELQKQQLLQQQSIQQQTLTNQPVLQQSAQQSSFFVNQFPTPNLNTINTQQQSQPSNSDPNQQKTMNALNALEQEATSMSSDDLKKKVDEICLNNSLCQPSQQEPTTCNDSDSQCQFTKVCYNCYSNRLQQKCLSCLQLSLIPKNDSNQQVLFAKKICQYVSGQESPKLCEQLRSSN